MDNEEAGGTRPSTKQLRRLLESQGYKCAYSGVALTPKTTSLDHCKPLCDGGDHSIENVRFVEREVNRAKGAMSLTEFVAMCRRVTATFDGKDAT
jgi:5-methylcytosine-specific restriction endonuclease McrA